MLISFHNSCSVTFIISSYIRNELKPELKNFQYFSCKTNIHISYMMFSDMCMNIQCNVFIWTSNKKAYITYISFHVPNLEAIVFLMLFTQIITLITRKYNYPRQ